MRLKARRLLASALAAALACAAGAHDDCLRPALAQKRVARRASHGVVYLALGDSTGVGVGAERGGYVERLFARVKRARPGSRLINLSARAAATTDVLREQVGRVPAARPTLITVGVGANDLIRGVPAERFAHNYEQIIARLKEENDAPILVMNIPDLALLPAVPAYMRDGARRHILLFNERIDEVAKRYGLPVVDLYGRSREFSSHPELFSRDGIHPSDAGYEFWAETVWPAMRKMLHELPK